MNVLIIGEPARYPPAIRELIGSGRVQATPVYSPELARDPGLLEQADAVLVCTPPGNHSTRLLADALLAHRLAGLMVSGQSPPTHIGASGQPPETAHRELDTDHGVLAPVSPRISPEELWGRLATVRQYRRLLEHLDRQVAAMQRPDKKLNQELEVDEDLRLACRLQRDFLPKVLPAVGDLRFAALYRPAMWVSGDIYDVRRLDETHVAFYLADAVGHGVAAGLLTMFIRQAVVGKHISGNEYELVAPHLVLASLNNQLAEQELPNCQFVTACYGMIDARTREVRLARGGHPHPILVSASGAYSEVRTAGGLLGVFPGEQFPSTSVQLQPGDKLVLYSDGIEEAILTRTPDDPVAFALQPVFLEALRRPAEECITLLAEQLDNREASPHPVDDQTCIVVEVMP